MQIQPSFPRILAWFFSLMALAVGSSFSLSHAASGDGVFIKDRNGCTVFDFRPERQRSFNWLGSCPNGQAVGAGTMEYFDSDGALLRRTTGVLDGRARFAGRARNEYPTKDGAAIWQEGELDENALFHGPVAINAKLAQGTLKAELNYVHGKAVDCQTTLEASDERKDLMGIVSSSATMQDCSNLGTAGRGTLVRNYKRGRLSLFAEWHGDIKDLRPQEISTLNGSVTVVGGGAVTNSDKDAGQPLPYRFACLFNPGKPDDCLVLVQDQTFHARLPTGGAAGNHKEGGQDSGQAVPPIVAVFQNALSRADDFAGLMDDIAETFVEELMDRLK